MLASDLYFPPPAPEGTARTLDQTERTARPSGGGSTAKRARRELPVLHTLYEPVDVARLRARAESLPDDHSEKYKLNRLADSADENGRVEVRYRKSNVEGIGRVFAERSVSVSLLSKEVRDEFCAPYFHDIDMVNAHPVIALHAAREQLELEPHQCAALKSYVTEREKYLAEMVPGDRATAKRLVLEIMFGKAMDVTYRNNTHYTRLRADLVRIRKGMYQKATELRALATKKGASNKAGSVFALYAGEVEYRIIVAAKSFMETRGWETCALTFDGFYARRRDDAQIDDALLRSLEASVLRSVGVPMKFEEKSFKMQK